MYPTEIHVGSHGSQSVYVTWRGVTTGIEEEPIQGYIVSDRNVIAEFLWIKWKQSNKRISLKYQILKLPYKN